MEALAAAIVRVQISRAGVVDRAHRLIGKIPRPSTNPCTLEAWIVAAAGSEVEQGLLDIQW